jgi:cell wall assembly regulator SMI1
VTVLAPLWTELTSWLAANAPRALADLRPPADPARLRAAEEELGFQMGPELTGWWHLHDGAASEASSIMPGYYLHGVDGMLADRRAGLEADLEVDLDRSPPEESEEAGGPARSFRPEFLPVGYDGAGNSLVVDCRPGPRHGCLKDHDHEVGALQPPLYEDLADLLTQVLGALRTGQELRGRKPAVYDGTLSWELAV